MKKIKKYIADVCNIWYRELRYILADEGLLLFLVVLPLAYPIIYSWIYDNEVAHEVPIAVVDRCHSAESREFIRKMDATAEVNVAVMAKDLSEVKDLIGKQEIFGAIVFPEDFSQKINRMEQSTVGVYCDMSIMLAYKNIYLSAILVSGEMGKKIQIKMLGNYTVRDDAVSTQPLQYDEVPIFNTTGGYGNFILPAVLILILQQTLLLAMGMTSGTLREKNGRVVCPANETVGILSIISGKVLLYMMLYAMTSSYVLLLVPKMFSFVSILHASDFFVFLACYLVACVFFSMASMFFMRQREDVMIIVVFTSILLLFISGVSWPGASMPKVWEYLGYIFPSTLGIKSFVALSSMGARISDILPLLLGLLVQGALYFVITVVIYAREMRQ